MPRPTISLPWLTQRPSRMSQAGSVAWTSNIALIRHALSHTQSGIPHRGSASGRRSAASFLRRARPVRAACLSVGVGATLNVGGTGGGLTPLAAHRGMCPAQASRLAPSHPVVAPFWLAAWFSHEPAPLPDRGRDYIILAGAVIFSDFPERRVRIEKSRPIRPLVPWRTGSGGIPR